MHTLLAYVPVLHQGYYHFFTHLPGTKKLYLIPSEIAAQYTPVHKEIRALSEERILEAISSWHIFESVAFITKEHAQELSAQRAPLVISDELVSKEFCAECAPNCPCTPTSIFLRWDRASATAEYLPHPESTLTFQSFSDQWMQDATHEGLRSSDWWRQVGAVLVKDGLCLASVHNTHLPTEQQPYIDGDARAHFHKGDHLELTTAIHAEAKLIAEAAKSGTSLEGCDLYVTDFPCPPCAKLIAFAGIKTVYYHKGYAVLDGESILQSRGVKIIQVHETNTQT